MDYKTVQHGFKYSCHDLVSLFNSVTTFDEFKDRLEYQSELDKHSIKKEDYLGDGFEFFVELLLRSFPFDKRLGIDGTDYEPVKKSEDMGVDAYSKNLENRTCAIQIKYRSSPKYVLSRKDDDLGSMIEESGHKKIVYAEDDELYRHFIITSAMGMHHRTEHDKFRNKVKCINNKNIAKIVDNNIAFWNSCLKVSKKLMSLRTK